MSEPVQCRAKLVASNGGYTHEIYCVRDAGHDGPHKGDTVWLTRPSCDQGGGAVLGRYECASCRDDGLTRHADCCQD